MSVFYALCIPVALSFYVIAKRLAFDRTSMGLLMAAITLFYFHFYNTTNADFTNDFEYHTKFIAYLAEDFWVHSYKVLICSPQLPEGLCRVPLYYILAAPIYQLGQMLGMTSPVELTRHFSVVCYLGFMLLGMLTLRTTLSQQSLSYHASTALLLFWPAGVTLAGRTHPDIFSYLPQMGVIYFLICWIRDRKTNNLANAFLLGGLAILIKMPSIIYLGVAGLCLLFALYLERYDWRRILTQRLIFSLLFAIGCYRFSLTYYVYLPVVTKPAEIPVDASIMLHVFTYFNPLRFVWDTMANTYVSDAYPPFWPYFLRTLVVSDAGRLKALVILSVIGVVLLAMLAYIIYGLLRCKTLQRPERGLILFCTFLCACLIGALAKVRYNQMDNIYFGDARYIFPIYTILVLAFGKVMEWHERNGRMVLARIGNGLVISMVMLTISLFLMQHIFLSKPQ